VTHMAHSTPEELIDVVDGTRRVSSLPHLADCAACRAQLDELRATIGEVAAIDVPEPPPLYWRQLSARVHDAVERERFGAGRRIWFLGGASWDTVWPWAAAAVLVLAVLVTTRRGAERQPQRTPTSTVNLAQQDSAPSVGSVTESARVDAERAPDALNAGDSADESLIAFMQDLAESMDAEAAGVSLRPDGSVTDAAVAELSPEERAEMQRLLQDAMRGSGV